MVTPRSSSPFPSRVATGAGAEFNDNSFILDDQDLVAATYRSAALAQSFNKTLLLNRQSIAAGVAMLADCMAGGEVVRGLGAGRASISGLMGLNRLSHGGARVSMMGGALPMPHSSRGGVIVAFSASGKTAPVLEAMEVGKANNPDIAVMGLASHDANEFRRRCDLFIGLWTPRGEHRPSLSALADIEEWVMGQVFDTMVVMAGQKLGYTDDDWRRGHEDIGPTGPYGPLQAQPAA